MASKHDSKGNDSISVESNKDLELTCKGDTVPGSQRGFKLRLQTSGCPAEINLYRKSPDIFLLIANEWKAM